MPGTFVNILHFLLIYSFLFYAVGQIYLFTGFPGGSDGKESACNAGDPGSIPGSGSSPGGGHGNPLQYSFLPAESHGQRSLAGYSLWGCKELDTTERLNHIYNII